jgi:cytochrome P450
MDYSIFATVDHEKHKMRRAALNPFFSTQSVRRLQPVVQERVDMLLHRIGEFAKSGELLMMSWAYAAFTNGQFKVFEVRPRLLNSDADVVMQYAFARSDHRLGKYLNMFLLGSVLTHTL